MSATGRGRVREAYDQYCTPHWCVHRLLEKIDLPGGVWLEPCAGYGDIIKGVNEVRGDVQWVAMEIQEKCFISLDQLKLRDLAIADFLATADSEFPSDISATVSNPPYNLAQPFIEKCLRLAPRAVMLLRLNFLEGEERCSFMRQYTPDVYVLPNRPSFTLGGTDATAYCFMDFFREKRSQGKVVILNSTPKEIRRPRSTT